MAPYVSIIIPIYKVPEKMLKFTLTLLGILFILTNNCNTRMDAWEDTYFYGT